MIQELEAKEIGKTNHSIVSSQRQGAIAAGVGLLLMIIPPIFARFVIEGTIVAGDAAATANNILANELQFRLAILGFIVVVVLDVIVSWGLYLFFEPVNRNVSLLAAWLRLLYTAVFAVAIFNLGHAVSILHTGVLEMDQLQAQALLSLSAFNNGWDLSLAIFGLHLILVGYLALKADYVPKILGILVVICGLGYAFDAVAGLLFPDFGVTVSLVTFIGEVLLGLWLAIKGLSAKQWEKLALKSA
jgi:hypothetical protein